MSEALSISAPLIRFDPLSTPLREQLTNIDTLRERYATAACAGEILAGVIEATRIELTYHSNAIEGNTLTLRETQLVLEGHVPPGQRELCEIYEARNHDRALRLVERWAAERKTAGFLVAIHPFADGNGRTARVLMNYLLLREGYPHTIIEVERRSEYLKTLDQANIGQWAPLAEFTLSAIERSFARILGPREFESRS